MIHRATLRVLREVGMKILHEGARQIFRDAGAEIDTEHRVFLDEELIDAAIASAPSEFMLHARNPAHNVRIGGNWMANSAIASPPNAGDLDGGRRTGNREDFTNLTKLTQYFNILHLNGGYGVEPVDIHAGVRHLECLKDIVTLTDKAFNIYSLGQQRNIDGVEIGRIANGLSEEQLRDTPVTWTIINTNSPLILDDYMAEGIISMAERGQIVVVTPFTLAGAMAPVTIPGAVLQQNAEFLVGLTLAQLVRKGAPVAYGCFTSNVDMKSGAPAFGTPEYMKSTLLGGQLTRKYGVPFRSSNVNAANAVDAQAAYESVFSIWAYTMGGANIVKHSAGWLEGGLRSSFEKMILDVDLLQMQAEFLKPLDLSEDELGIEAMKEAGHGGHFFGTAHTQARYTDAFYQPLISNWQNFETWDENGQQEAAGKANELYKAALADYQQPAFEEDRRDELAAFVAKRTEQGGVATDF